MTDDDVLTAAARRVPSRREVAAAFTRAADKARRSKSPSLSWLLSVDGKLLPLLGEVYGNPPQARREFLQQVRAHLRDIDLEMPDRAAETEYEGALQAGRLARRAVDASPYAVKTWVTMHDERVRPSHALLEGTTLPLGEMFDVGGFDGQHPGDWRLPPAERIDCRCRLVFAAPLTADGGPEMDSPVAAGLAVVARDTGRVLMLQRHLGAEGTDEDPNAGLWEFPGGVLDPGETPLDAALREFTEETGITPAPDDLMDAWVSDNGVYQLFIATVDNEADLDIHQREHGLNPDDPDGDRTEALAWWSPEDAAQNPALRPEVQNTPWSLLDCGCDGGAGSIEVAEELFAEALEAGEVVQVGERSDGVVLYDRIGDPLDEAIALHEKLMNSTVMLTPQTQQQLMDMLDAADAERGMVAAAGGLDKNRGNAEQLRHYWTFGPGGQRIRWGIPGDFDRCVTELTPHLGARSKGYCALRHHDATGFWPGHAPGEEKALHASTAEDLLAAGSPYPGEHIYDADLFNNPHLTAATPLTIDGTRVYGHVADWSVCHRSFKKCRTAPRSRSGYSQFHVGEVMTSAGALAVGNLVLATDHASLTMNASAASQHYADSGSAVAVVRAGEDKHGIWVAGSIIEGTEPHLVAALRRCPLSGDWRAGEMVAALAVNVPGLPIAREYVTGGRQMSMVAAGALPNPHAERLTALYDQIRQERLAETYADILAERVL